MITEVLSLLLSPVLYTEVCGAHPVCICAKAHMSDGLAISSAIHIGITVVSVGNNGEIRTSIIIYLLRDTLSTFLRME